MFHNSILKISEKLNKRNLLKSAYNLPALQISAKSTFSFYCGEKNKIFDFFKNQWHVLRVKLFVQR